MGAVLTSVQAFVAVAFLALLGTQELVRAHRSQRAVQRWHRLEPYVFRLGAAFVIVILWRLRVLSA